MIKRTRMAACVLLVVGSVVVAGCSSEVSGRVVGANTGDPIPGAVVTVSGANTKTRADGSFALSAAAADRAQGKVKVAGFPEAAFDALESHDGEAVVRIPDSSLKLTVKENALAPQPVKKYQVMLDGREFTTRATIWPLSPGEHKLVVRSEGREEYRTTLVLKPGDNNVKVALSLTPTETYERFFKAARAGKGYRYLNPDEHSRRALKKLKACCAQISELSIKYETESPLPKWKSMYVGRDHMNVAEIHRILAYRVTDASADDYGKTNAEHLSQRWAKTDGRWYLVQTSTLK